jgi:hypothetical protein
MPLRHKDTKVHKVFRDFFVDLMPSYRKFKLPKKFQDTKDHKAFSYSYIRSHKNEKLLPVFKSKN